MKNLATTTATLLILLTAASGRCAPLFSSHDQQVEALLAQMTQDEKIGQMVQVDSSALKDPADVQKYLLGSVLSGGNSDPAAGNTAQNWLDFVTTFQTRRSKPGSKSRSFTASTPCMATTTSMAR